MVFNKFIFLSLLAVFFSIQVNAEDFDENGYTKNISVNAWTILEV